MRFIRVPALILILTISLSVAFFACSGDNKKKSEPVTVTTTLGQELLDLKKAYEDGIITEKEYEKTKKALIENRTE